MSTLRVGTIKSKSGNITIPTNVDINVSGTFSLDRNAEVTIPAGTSLERPGPSDVSNGMIRLNNDLDITEVYIDGQWVELLTSEGTGGAAASALVSGDGTSAENAAISATQLKADYPNTGDGAYYYFIPGTEDTIRLYTDMTRDGGGWVVISKWGGHSKTIDKVYNTGDRNLSNLTNANFPGYGDFDRPSRVTMNRIWKASKFVTRIHFKNTQSTSSSGVYFQQKITKVQEFDFWKGHYHPHYWSDWNRNSYQATGGGTYYSVAFTNAIGDPTLANYSGTGNFDSSTNNVTGGTDHNDNMGWWDRATINAPGFGKFEVARHMGYFGDISIGNQWLFTNNPGDNRWGGNENKQSVIFLRW